MNSSGSNFALSAKNCDPGSMLKKLLAAAAVCASLLLALAKIPFQAQSASTVSYTVEGDGETVEIHNVAWQYTGTRVPGRPADERLLLRTTTHEKDFVGDIPEPGAVTLEAWPLGADPKQKPLYSVKLEAMWSWSASRYRGQTAPQDTPVWTCRPTTRPMLASKTRTWWRCWSTRRKIAFCAKP